MKSFVYTGPLSGVSLNGHGDFLLIPNAIVKLPAHHEYTARLIRKGWLEEVKAAETKETEKPTDDVVTEKKRRK